VTSVVETHSEYLLIRLRRRLAEHAKPPVSVVPKLRRPRRALSPAVVSILLSQVKGTQGEISKLEIGKGFQFENLPPGFMSQITEDRMFLLKAVSKKNA
jgi:predicted ATPase